MFTFQLTKLIALSALAAIFVGASPTQAGVVSLQTNLTDSGLPTWVRPDENAADPYAAPVKLFDASSSQFAPEKVPMAYRSTAIQVGTTGQYSFFTSDTARKDKGDHFSLLYQGVFDPNQPFLNALIANDDAYESSTGVRHVKDDLIDWSTAVYGSGFTVNLQANTRYILVNTLFAGDYLIGADDMTTTISGPGSIGMVPEPASAALVLLALGALALTRQRSAA